MADPSNIFAHRRHQVPHRLQHRAGRRRPRRRSRRAIDRYYDKASILDEVMEGFDDDDIDFDRRTRTTSTSPSSRSASEDAPVVKLVQPDPHRRDQEERVGHPHRALREELPRPLPHRRRALRGDEAAAQAEERDHLAPQDHGGARHRRAPPAAGRPHQAEDRASGKEMDFRVSVLPTLFGEKIVLRLLDKSNLQLDMTKLGFEQKQLDGLQARRSTSPTAWCSSPGRPARARRPRSTRRSPSSTRSARTSPPPRTRSSSTCSASTRCRCTRRSGSTSRRRCARFLRQDPDIIMVGEIRDFETAEIAVKAALTGHLVLSTLHTNDAPSTVNRLLNMGIEPFLVAVVGELHRGAAPRAQGLRGLQGARRRGHRAGADRRRAQRRGDRARRRSFKGARLPRPARTPATRAASRSTR